LQLKTSALGTCAGSVTFADNDNSNNPFQFAIAGTVVVATNITSIVAPPVSFAGQTFIYSATIGGGGNHTATWNWGDGTTSPGTVNDANGTVTGSHAYATGNAYTITLTVTDNNVNASTSATQSVLVSKGASAVLAPDPLNPAETALYVGGTSGNDTILFGCGMGGAIQVAINTRIVGSFMPTGHLIAYGLGGNDTIMVSSKIHLNAWLFGGNGNDTFTGGGGMNLIIGGGTGIKKLTAGPGGAADNYIIPGTSPWQTNFQALTAAMATWEGGGSKLKGSPALSKSMVSQPVPTPAVPAVRAVASANGSASLLANDLFFADYGTESNGSTDDSDALLDPPAVKQLAVV
jgi:PKD repeat protein